MERTIENARIESTFLGPEDHGMMSYLITLNYGGSMQGFGNYGLDYFENGKWCTTADDARHIEVIRGVLEVAGVRSWEELVGKYVRADHDNLKVYRLGHIVKDEWVDPHQILEP